MRKRMVSLDQSSAMPQKINSHQLNSLMMNQFLEKNPTLVTASIAIIVSVISLWLTIRFSRRNIRIALQQAIFKIVQEKARDCNTVWKNEPVHEMTNLSPHYLVMTELVISKEVIDKSFELFATSFGSISRMRDDYYYLFYKQLHPDLRGYIHRSEKIASSVDNVYFTRQVIDVHAVVKKHFEQVI